MDRRSRLLTVDGIANLLFGLALLAFPRPFFEALGIPWTDHGLYPTILGGVLIGIGVALIQESRSRTDGVGLGLWGAVAINLVAGLVIAGWLLGSRAEGASTSGRVFLWLLVLFLVGLSAGEIATLRRAKPMTDGKEQRVNPEDSA